MASDERARNNPDQQSDASAMNGAQDEDARLTGYEAAEFQWGKEPPPRRVFVCIGATCTELKGRGILAEMKKQVNRTDLGMQVEIYTSTCLSHCAHAPVIQVFPEGIFYCGMSPRDVKTIVRDHFQNGTPVRQLAFDPLESVQWNEEMDS